MFDERNDLSDSCWHHVEVRRRRARLTVIVDKEKSRKSSEESSTSHFKLNLNNNTSNVIYYGGGPSDKLVFAQTKPLSFRGFLKQFHFEQMNVIDNALISQRKDFKISDPRKVGIAEMHNVLLQSAEGKCKPEPTGSGCSPDDDDSDPSCNPLTTTPTKGRLSRALFTLYQIALAPARKSYWAGLLFTHNNRDFGAISAPRQPRRKLSVTYRIGYVPHFGVV